MTEPQYFEHSGTDPGVNVPSSLPDPEAETAAFEFNRMSMIEHIAELRRRILLSALTLLITVSIGFYWSLPVIQWFQRLAPKSVIFVQISLGEVLMTSLYVSFYIGVAMALPVLLYHLLRFVLPGLRPREKNIISWIVVGGTALFALGVVFAYFCVVPTAVEWLVDFGSSVARGQISVQSYVSFCAAMLFVTGAMFELPLVLFLLSFTGLITSDKLVREWRWATVLIFIVAAIVTPTQDPFSMTIVGLAMVALYGLSIIPIRLIGK